MGYYDDIASGYEELHGAEQRRKLSLLSQHIAAQGRLLDVGCGTGISTDFFAATCECTGIDPSAGLIAQNTTGSSTFVVGFAESLPFDDGEFDWVISLTALQNFEDIALGLSEIKRVGKGNFVLTWLKKSSKSEQIASCVVATFGKPTAVLDDIHDVIYVFRR